MTVVTKKQSAVKGTATSQLTSRVLSRDHQMTERARPIVPIAQKVTSAKPSERQGHPLNSRLSRDMRAAGPIPTSKPTSARRRTVCLPSVPCPPQQAEKPTNEKPCIEALLPTAHLPETYRTEGTRTIRLRKGGPPPFKPVSRAQRVISTCDPQDSTPVTFKPVYRKGLLFGDSISTTPKGSPPIRATAHALRGANHIDATRPRCMEGSTSTTPVTWPTHCADLFAPSLHDVYVSPKCVSDHLKRAPRNYRPPRDCLDTPSPCGRVKATYSHSPTTTPPSRTIYRSNLYTSSTGKNLKPFQLPLPLEFKSEPVELSLSTNAQPCGAAQVPVVPPMPAWLKELFEKCPPPSFEMCIRNRFEFECR